MTMLSGGHIKEVVSLMRVVLKSLEEGSLSPPSGRSGATQCLRYQVSHIEEVVALMKVVLKHLEEGLSEPSIREIKALQELHSVHVIRWVISRRYWSS